MQPHNNEHFRADFQALWMHAYSGGCPSGGTTEAISACFRGAW